MIYFHNLVDTSYRVRVQLLSHFCHIPAKLRPKPSWVGCIIGLKKNPTTTKPMCPYIFRPLQDYLLSWFSECSLSSTKQDDSCKKRMTQKKCWPNFFDPNFFRPAFFFGQKMFDQNFILTNKSFDPKFF